MKAVPALSFCVKFQESLHGTIEVRHAAVDRKEDEPHTNGRIAHLLEKLPSRVVLDQLDLGNELGTAQTRLRLRRLQSAGAASIGVIYCDGRWSCQTDALVALRKQPYVQKVCEEIFVSDLVLSRAKPVSAVNPVRPARIGAARRLFQHTQPLGLTEIIDCAQQPTDQEKAQVSTG